MTETDQPRTDVAMIPRKGSMVRAWAEWYVHWRRLGRSILSEMRGWLG